MRAPVAFFVGLSVFFFTACAQIPVSGSGSDSLSAGAPSGGAVSSAFGFRIVSPPESVKNGETRITVVASEDLELLAFLSRKDDRSHMFSWVQVESTGKLTWTLNPVFSETGAFVVSLSGKRKDDPGKTYTLLAEWPVVAETASADASVRGPEGVAGRGGVTTTKTVKDSSGSAASSPRPEAVQAAFAKAVQDGNLREVRNSLKKCSSEDAETRSVYVSALKAVLFSPPERAASVTSVLTTAGMDPNLTDEDEWTLLQSAVNANRIDIAEWLLSRGADVNARGPGRTAALHTLAETLDGSITPKGFVEWARLFLQYGASIDAQTMYGATAVNLIAGYDPLHEFLAFLVESGADFNIGDEEGNAPLSLAVQHGARKNAEYLKARGARLYSYEFPVDNEAPACAAVLSGDRSALDSLPIEEFGRMVARTSMAIPATPLHLAAERGDMRTLKVLCAKGVDWNVPDRYGRSPLFLAVLAGRADEVSLLLKYGADPHFGSVADGMTPFLAACSLKPDVARKMLAEGVEPRGKKLPQAVVGSEDLALVQAIGNRVVWEESSLVYAANLGLVDITTYLCTLVDPDGSRFSKYIQRSRERSMEIREYEARSVRLSEVPRRAGGIADKRGTFPYVVETWSPWSPQGKARLADCPVGVYVPQEYDGSRPYGLVVSMTNAKSSSPYPRDFSGTLDRHNLIWVGFDPYKCLRGENTEFCLALVYNMMAYYNIDPSRIYVGGFSYGGQLTDNILYSEPWLFDGAFFINMAHSGFSTLRAESVYRKRHISVVIVEGDYDYLRTWAYNEYDSMLSKGFDLLQFFHEPMKGHKLISAASFERIICLLEAGGT